MDDPKTHTWEACKQGMLRGGASFLARAAGWTTASTRTEPGDRERRQASKAGRQTCKRAASWQAS